MDTMEERSSTLEDAERVLAGSIGMAGVNRTLSSKRKRTAWYLGLAGLIPFCVLSLILANVPDTSPLYALTMDALKTYGAIIGAFMAGTRWGPAIKDNESRVARRVLIASNIPPIILWTSLFIPGPVVFAVQAICFAALGAWDSFAGQNGVFGLWYVRLRIVLTFCVVGFLLVAFFVTI